MRLTGMQDIFEKMQDRLDAGEDLVLAVVTEASGSTPRGKGAAMLTGPSGLICGTIGGGVLEAEALKEAAVCLAEKRSRQFEYRMDSDAAAEDGMICGGSATVLLQYIAAGQKDWLQQLKEQIGADSPLFASPERAFIFGGGHIAAALAPILKSVGFLVVVMDDRAEFADPARFPDAAQAVCGDFRHLAKSFTFCESDYAVIVTSGHMHDFEVEEQLLRQELAYIGVIGSRKKTAAVNAKLREAGISEEQLAKVHTPIGLAIGAVTSEEIAVSIAAEMIQVRAERRKGS